MFDGRVILVNYRSAGLVRTRVRELRGSAERPAEIVVVDNDPGGGLPEGLDGLGVDVRWLSMPRNVGFAAAVNRGMEGLRLPFALWLNPDARPDPGVLSGLQQTLRECPRAAVAAPALVPPEPGAPIVPSATRIDPSWRTVFVEYGPWGARGRRWLDRRYFLTPGDTTAPTACAALQGACFAVRREAWEAVGPLDDGRFFLYWEETDFCRRARAAGWTVLFCPALRCEHEGGASVAVGRQDVDAFWRSADAYFRKHRGPRRAAVIRFTAAAGTLACMALFGAGRLLRPSRRAAGSAYLNLLAARWRALRALSGRTASCAS